LQCAGWGHIKDDWAKKGHAMSKKNYCPTTKYNDIVYQTYIGNKEEYKNIMQLELKGRKRQAANSLGFVFPEQDEE
jgi:hypothetical protein